MIFVVASGPRFVLYFNWLSKIRSKSIAKQRIEYINNNFYITYVQEKIMGHSFVL